MIDAALIRSRKSVRTFDGRPLSSEDRAALAHFLALANGALTVADPLIAHANAVEYIASVAP